MDQRTSNRTAGAILAAVLLLVGPLLAALTPLPSSLQMSLSNIDELLYRGQYGEAEDQARDALAALAARHEDDSATAAPYADRLVEALLAGERGPKPDAVLWARRAVVLNERRFGAEALETTRSLVRLGRVLATRSEFVESMTTLQRALHLLQSELGPDHADVATAKLGIGFLLMKQAKPEEAVPWLEQARAIRERALGASDIAVAEALEMLGTCLSRQGRGDAAETHLREALTTYEQTLGSVHPHVGEVLVSLGNAQGYADLKFEARASLERGLAILEAAYGPDSIMATRALDALGYVYLADAEWSRASQYFERGLAIVVRELGEESQQAAEALLALGIVRTDMGDPATAATLEARAASTLERLHGPWHPQLGRALRHLGVSLTNLGRFAEAEPVMLRALAITERNNQADSYAVANALRSIGSNYVDAEKYQTARSYSLRALEIFGRLEPTGKPSASIAYVLGDLGLASRGLGDPAVALEYLKRGLEHHESVLGPAHIDNAFYLTAIARVLYEVGEYDAAREAAQRADAIIGEHVRVTGRVSSEEQALASVEVSRSAVDLLISAVTGVQDVDDAAVLAAWDAEIRARGRILDGLIERRQLLIESKDPDLAACIGALQAASERLSKLVVRGPGSRGEQVFRQDLEAARSELKRAELSLAAHGEARRSTSLSNQVGLADVTMSLPPKSAMVAFVRYGRVDLTPRPGQVRPVTSSSPAYVAFILRGKEAAPIAVPLGDAVALDSLVARWRAAIANEARAAGRASRAGEDSYRKVAEELRRAVWDPVAPELGAVTQVFVVPDGTLNLVSFGSLPTAKGNYLAEQGPRLHYLSAERDITAPQSPGSTGGLLAFSAPDFDDRRLFAARGSGQGTLANERTQGTGSDVRGTRSACSNFQAMRFEPLPASAMEAQQIVTLWQRANTTGGPDDEGMAVSLTASGASEAMFKQRAPGHRVLHVATHGFFLGEACGAGDSDPDGSANAAFNEVTRENPLLLSGLVFAGANRRNDAAPDEQDGILTAQEIATLDLQGTEWAVLSACDTGLGATRTGEGVFGLRRAFQQAGARTVIMSLWAVEDEATRQWMTALYRHRLIRKKSTVDSVGGAALELLNDRRSRGQSTHPFYWAGFVAAGDWR